MAPAVVARQSVVGVAHLAAPTASKVVTAWAKPGAPGEEPPPSVRESLQPSRVETRARRMAMAQHLSRVAADAQGNYVDRAAAMCADIGHKAGHRHAGRRAAPHTRCGSRPPPRGSVVDLSHQRQHPWANQVTASTLGRKSSCR